jgi:hypothetical protein
LPSAFQFEADAPALDYPPLRRVGMEVPRGLRADELSNLGAAVVIRMTVRSSQDGCGGGLRVGQADQGFHRGTVRLGLGGTVVENSGFGLPEGGRLSSGAIEFHLATGGELAPHSVAI